MEMNEGAAAAGDIVLDFSRLCLNTFNVDSVSDERIRDTRQLYLNHNHLTSLPSSLSLFCNLKFLDISSNGLKAICEGITWLFRLKTLIAKDNCLDESSLPRDFGLLQLEVLDLSGNRFWRIPPQCTKLLCLRSLSFQGNRLTSIPAEIENVSSLVLLYLGGNLISVIPPEVANLPYLNCLVLCDNLIQSVPPQLARLHSLESLNLDNNLITYVCVEMMDIAYLSYSGNPTKYPAFRSLTKDPSSLLDLATYTIWDHEIPYHPGDLPATLLEYLGPF